MMAAMDIGIIVQISGQKRLNRCIRLAFGAAIESDARIGQCDLRAAANSAADQGIHSPLHQESRQCPMTAAFCSHHFRANHASVCYLINLKLFCMAKMLKNLAILISHCNFHNRCSFQFVLLYLLRQASAATPARGMLPSSTNSIVTAGNHQPLAINQTSRNLVPCIFIDFLHCGARNIHLCRALPMVLSFQIHQSDYLIFIQRQQNWIILPPCFRTKAIHLRHLANSTASLRSWHHLASLFPAYTDYTTIHRKNQPPSPPESSIRLSSLTVSSNRSTSADGSMA